MAKTDTSDTTTDTITTSTGAGAAPAGGTSPPASLGATSQPPTPAAEPTVHVVTRPLGTEFPVTDHQSIAAKFKAEVEHVCYVIETDLENGVHRLKGWLKSDIGG